MGDLMIERHAGPWPWVRHLRVWIARLRRDRSLFLHARISLVPVILGFLLLLLPQGLDVVRDLVDSANQYLRDPAFGPFSSGAWGSYFRWGCFLSACVWSGIIAWYWPHLLARSRRRAAEPVWFAWLRRAIGLAPLLAATWAILRTGQGHLRDVWIALTCFVLATLLLWFFFVRRVAIVQRRFADSWFRRPSRIMTPLVIRLGGKYDPELTFGDDLFVLSSFGLALLLLIMFVIPGWRTEFAVGVGAASIAFGAVGSMIAIVSAAIWFFSGPRLPVISLGAVMIVAFSVTNDNHRIAPIASPSVASRLDLRQAFAAWERRNPDGPIILVATAGGASRAGYWTASVLRSLDDRTGGGFASQVFAISSVSGGTLGALGYAAWVADHPVTGSCAYDPRGRLAFVRSFDGGDYLSPALGGLLYPDLAQQFVPFPLFPDRARALEESWDMGWKTSVERSTGCAATRSPDRFAGDFLTIWDESLRKGGPWVPLVIANGTLVESGKRVITAPIKVEPSVFEDSHDFFDLFGQSVSGSTAVLNSARFPVVSPAATLPYKDGFYHIIDGGYFENGGLESIYDVARSIRATIGSKRPILIIEINNDDAAPGDPYAREDLARYPNGANADGISLGVALPKPSRPLAAEGVRAVFGGFFLTRTSRGVLGAKRLSSTRSIGLSATVRATFNLGPLLSNRRTAMSWSLSLSSRKAMDDALQALGPWLNPDERTQIAADRTSLDSNFACQRLVADQIAGWVGAALPIEPSRCNPQSVGAAWIGVPLRPAPAAPRPR